MRRLARANVATPVASDRSQFEHPRLGPQGQCGATQLTAFRPVIAAEDDRGPSGWAWTS